MLSTHTKTLIFVTTYPPRKCGIATFTQDLVSSIKKYAFSNLEVKIAAINPPGRVIRGYPPEVKWIISQNKIEDYKNLAYKINNSKKDITVLIQHEYGIFGGEYGSNLLEFTTRLKKPMITILHTVLPNPNSGMKNLTQSLINKSKNIVVMSGASKKVIFDNYEISRKNKVKVIHHGIHPVLFEDSSISKEATGSMGKTVLTTFGLLSRNKGIEYVLDSLPEVVKKYPNLVYMVVGATHPVVKVQEKETYRKFLKEKVKSLGIKKHVRFIDQYLPVGRILDYLKSTDIYLATSLDPNQSVSGTFSYALGCGRAVVSTKFSHAKGLLTPKVGRLVESRNSGELTQTLLELLSDPEKIKGMHWNAYKKTRKMLWANVSHEYIKLIGNRYLPPVNTKHLNKMIDDFGMLQFSIKSVPDKNSWYTADDNSRAIIVFIDLFNSDYLDRKTMIKNINKLLLVIEKSGLPDAFANEIDGTNPPNETSRVSEDAEGRIFWAICEILKEETLADTHIEKRARKIFNTIKARFKKYQFIKSTAFALYGLTSLPKSPENVQDVFYLSEKLLREQERQSSQSWVWFEDKLTYANGIVPAALIKAGVYLESPEYVKSGLSALNFLCSKTFIGGVYVPIGQSGWFQKSKPRKYFDQQPEDPFHTTLALYEAWRLTKNKKYFKYMEKCFSWFFGNNLTGTPMYNPKTGGVHDGLSEKGVNKNQGAESLLSYLMTRIIMEKELQDKSEIKIKKRLLKSLRFPENVA